MIEEHPEWKKTMSLPPPLTKEQARCLVIAFDVRDERFRGINTIDEWTLHCIDALLAIADQNGLT